jgi:hypothetical protein
VHQDAAKADLDKQILKAWPLSIMACHIFICSISLANAASVDSPDIVYIDGLPCNSACQSYMDWSRPASGQQPSDRSQPVVEQQKPTAKVQKASKVAPRKLIPTRVATQTSAKHTAKMVAEDDKQSSRDVNASSDRINQETAPAATAVPTPMPDPRPAVDTATKPSEQVDEPLYAVRRDGIKPDSHKPTVVGDFLV